MNHKRSSCCDFFPHLRFVLCEAIILRDKEERSVLSLRLRLRRESLTLISLFFYYSVNALNRTLKGFRHFMDILAHCIIRAGRKNRLLKFYQCLLMSLPEDHCLFIRLEFSLPPKFDPKYLSR